MASDVPEEIQIHVKGASLLDFQISIALDQTVTDLKHAIAEKCDVAVSRQRLVYSGHVLKDEDLLSVYKIQSSHTIHLVVRPDASSSTAQTGTTPQQLPTMQAGQNPLDPLTQLNSHRGYGAMAGLNPFSELGVNHNDPNMMLAMMNNPQVMAQISEMMSNPDVMNQIMETAMPPQMREQMGQIMQSPVFREMMSNPETLQQMMRLATAFQGSGGLGNQFGSPPSFPAPGSPNATMPPTEQSETSRDTLQQDLQMSRLLGGGAGGLANPFGVPSATTPTSNTSLPTGHTQTGAPSVSHLASLLNGGTADGGGGLNPAMMQFLSRIAGASTETSLEQQYSVQLGQLHGMGFTNVAQNVRALIVAEGNVESAVGFLIGENNSFSI